MRRAWPMNDVAIVDNGGANIASLRFALDRLGASFAADGRPGRAAPRASRVILPGVGAAGDAMERLRALELVDVIPHLTQPVLGICLGMQLLFEAQRRRRHDAASGIIPARVTRLPPARGLARAAHGVEPAARARSESPLIARPRRRTTTSISCTALPRRSARGRSRRPTMAANSRHVVQRAQFPRRAVPPGTLVARRRAPARQLPGAPARMRLIPAIDLRGGRCVRLLPGPLRRRDRLCDDPARVAGALSRARRALPARRRPRRCARRLARQPRRRRSARAPIPAYRIQVGGGVRSARRGRRAARPRRAARRRRQRRGDAAGGGAATGCANSAPIASCSPSTSASMRAARRD